MLDYAAKIHSYMMNIALGSYQMTNGSFGYLSPDKRNIARRITFSSKRLSRYLSLAVKKSLL
jgi:hypothetical protein